MDEETVDARAVLGTAAADVVGRCLHAWAAGPFIEDWEFSTVTGLTREEVAAVYDSWPLIRDLAVTNQSVRAALGNLLSYPHGLSLERELGVSEAAVRDARAKWHDLALGQ